MFCTHQHNALATLHCIPVLVATLGGVVAAAASPLSPRVCVCARPWLQIVYRLAHIVVSSLTSSFLVCCVVGVARMNTSSRWGSLTPHNCTFIQCLCVCLHRRPSQLSQTRDADAARAAREERAFLRLKQSAARTIQRYWRGKLMSTYMMIARQPFPK
jgi:hypothetical protein